MGVFVHNVEWQNFVPVMQEHPDHDSDFIFSDQQYLRNEKKNQIQLFLNRIVSNQERSG